jgi:hypothetical protein
VIVPFGLYAGWTVCATFVNIAEVAPAYGFNRFGLSIPHFAAISIAAATMVAGVILWLSRGALAFSGSVVWALVGIIAAEKTRGADPLVALAAAAAIVAVVVVAAWLNIYGNRIREVPANE